MEKATPPCSRLSVLLWGAIIIFSIADLLGQVGPHLESNQLCFRLLGCNSGFLGYDALCHFLFGIVLGFGLLWLNIHSPKRFALLQAKEGWKNILILVACVALFCVIWELGEFSIDIFRSRILHIDLLHPMNVLLQPSDNDTMGDMAFCIFGSFISLLIARVIEPASLMFSNGHGKKAPDDSSASSQNDSTR